MHKEKHEQLARGGLPHDVREFLKAFGWAVAHNDGGIDRLKDRQDSEVGKLAVAYSWWTRAKMLGINEGEFDDFMAAHLLFIDAKVEKNIAKVAQAANRIERWEQYAG